MEPVSKQTILEWKLEYKLKNAKTVIIKKKKKKPENWVEDKLVDEDFDYSFMWRVKI